MISPHMGLAMHDQNSLILGIESSCDDTAVALVAEDGTVAAALTQSQAEIHAQYGGVYPELASRAHAAEIIPTIRQTLKQINAGPEHIRAIAVTRGPGLIGPLLVGLNAAEGLGLGWSKPVIGINHLRGHLRSAELDGGTITYPAIVLLASGGHTLIAYMKDAKSVEILGGTRDDSVGEAYDKVARMLGLEYPGGPAVDKLAKTGAPDFTFPRPMIREGLEFSFSGLKSAVARLVEREPDVDKPTVAASFVAAAMDVLAAKCARALTERKAASLVVVGGVSASPQLRERTAEVCAEAGVDLALPSLKWSTDNGAMIALAGWDSLDMGLTPHLKPATRLSIEQF